MQYFFRDYKDNTIGFLVGEYGGKYFHPVWLCKRVQLQTMSSSSEWRNPTRSCIWQNMYSPNFLN